jgi:hypothetical protein
LPPARGCGDYDDDQRAGESVSHEDGAEGTSVSPGTRPASREAQGSRELTRLTDWLAAAAIITSTLIMILISAAGPSVSVPSLRASGLPWWHSLHLTATFFRTVSLWAAMVLGCAGVIAGLIAVARGARPPVRPIIAFAFLAVVVLTVLAPAGSTDSISYAASGRIAVIGHSPYVMTPLQLERIGDPVGNQIPFREIPSPGRIRCRSTVRWPPERSGSRPSLAGRRWRASPSG